MRAPACPVAPATKTERGSLRRAPAKKDVEGAEAMAGTSDFASGSFPKSTKNRLGLGASSAGAEGSSLGLLKLKRFCRGWAEATVAGLVGLE